MQIIMPAQGRILRNIRESDKMLTSVFGAADTALIEMAYYWQVYGGIRVATYFQD
jgi:hypothetical protein